VYFQNELIVVFFKLALVGLSNQLPAGKFNMLKSCTGYLRSSENRERTFVVKPNFRPMTDNCCFSGHKNGLYWVKISTSEMTNAIFILANKVIKFADSGSSTRKK
jgi:hypothetical protein